MSVVNRETASGAFPELPLPLYEHVKRRIAEAILAGTLPPGTVMPGEVALAAEYGVAVGTIRRALADLTADGMLMRRRKTGTIVTGRTPQHSLRFFFHYFRLHGADGSRLRSEPEVLSLSRSPATPQEAAPFGIDAGEDLIHLHRLRRVGGRPVMHARMMLVARRLPDFPQDAAEVPPLIYLHLLERYGIRVSAVRERVTAELATDADCTLLGLERPAALLVIDEEAYDQTGAVVIVSQHRAQTHGYSYVNEIR
ncbi:GntR family transcriptional regulator [Limobrevibacterium gyesilva]|uniref:GntR family transcriptional regulator n=1 Tax=Limobrevibacterium gyesilva TaxID=2991712 RepID=A0AA42CIN3_9PROT|nr:GntR family transcriptional regulator [Limobrevibacterium gyesilva]MCW3476060.1 GntR family transcriptional regulator [Limobrevibacterium gyesilva]